MSVLATLWCRLLNWFAPDRAAHERLAKALEEFEVLLKGKP